MANKFIGVADSAQKLNTPRTISLTGNASGSATFDGSSDISIDVLNSTATTATKWATPRTITLTGNASGSVSIDGSNNVTLNVSNSYATEAWISDMVVGVYTNGGGQQPPSYIPKGRVRFNMMNGLPGITSAFAGYYCDCMLMDTYTGSDVPTSTGFGINRTTDSVRAWIFNGAQGGSTWRRSAELITTGNIGTQSVAQAVNADTLDGCHGSSSQQINTYVLRDKNGYAYFNYINSNTSASENPSIGSFIVTNSSQDGFYRKCTLASAKYQLGVPSVINNVASTDTGSALSANMGRSLYNDIMRGTQATSKMFTVTGDANTYYPVLISGGNFDYYAEEFINISRRYNERAPSSWNTSTHMGGLTLCMSWNFDGYWGGNSGLTPIIYRISQTYSTMVADVGVATTGLVVFLRGGTADYHFNSTLGTLPTITVYYSTYTDAANRTFSPTTTISPTWISRAINYTAYNKPTPAEIGALATGGTAVNSNALGSIAAANYINTSDTLILRGVV